MKHQILTQAISAALIVGVLPAAVRTVDINNREMPTVLETSDGWTGSD